MGRSSMKTRLFIGLCLLLGLLFSGAALAAPEDYADLRQANGGRLAPRLRFIPTVRQSVILTFGGLSKEEPLRDILDKLDENGMRGTFFVSERELKRNAANIDLIASRGQELAIGLRGDEKADFSDFCAQIERIHAALKERYGVETNYVRLVTGPDSPALQEAVSAMGCMLFGQGLNIVQSKHKDAASADEVMPDIFGKWTTSLNRGEVVYLRTDFYSHPLLAGEMMMAVKRAKIDNIAYRTYDDSPETNPANDSAYRVEAAGDVLADTGHLWEYPIDQSRVPPDLRPGYAPFVVNDENFEREFYKRYIGSPLVNEGDRMTGFSRDEMARADKTGVVKTVTDNTVFLTFDDWGNDDSINHILYVLRKHHVPGTFFIITWNMPNNPNLLRAIAADGHAVSSHTNQHKAMNRRDEKGKQIPVMAEDEYAADVQESFRRLSDTIGDMVVEGRRPLNRLMRPPTLAVSRSGARALFDAGFTFIVNGYESTEDYAQTSLKAMVGALQNGIYRKNGTVRKGAILVMHMSATAKFTARALDIMLTANERRADDDPGKFRIGRLEDYVAEGYDQTDRHVTKLSLR